MPSSNRDGRGAEGPGIPRGFASMDPERQREVAGQGGRAAHEQGATHESAPEVARSGSRGGRPATAHAFDDDQARAASRKGGEAAGVHRKPQGGEGR